jgi:hypothetical protein
LSARDNVRWRAEGFATGRVRERSRRPTNQLHPPDQFRKPFHCAVDRFLWQYDFVKQRRRHFARESEQLRSRLRKIRPREFVLRNELEHLRVDGGAQWLDRVPHKGVAPFLVAMQIADGKA